MNVRTFFMLNARAEYFDLMRKDAFFSSPDGLGAEVEINSADFGNFYLKTYEHIPQKVITGEMIFKGYEQYDEFVRFSAASPLTLYRTYDGQNSESLKCELTSLTLGEKESDTGRLICSVDFTAFTPWESPQLYYATIPLPDDTLTKKYPHRYPHRYVNSSSGSVMLYNPSVYDAPMKLTIYGAASNPTFAISQNGKSYGTGKINITLADGERLIIDSNPESAEISKVSADWQKTDAYQLSDFTTERFLYAPPGVSRLIISDSDFEPIAADVEIFPIVR